jgi:hypothetical protein
VNDGVHPADQPSHDPALGDRGDRAVEARMVRERGDVLDLTGGEVIEHVHVVPVIDQQIAEM